MPSFGRTRRGVENPSNRVVLDVDHVTYNIGTVDSLDFNLRNCLPEHRDALLRVAVALRGKTSYIDVGPTDLREWVDVVNDVLTEAATST